MIRSLICALILVLGGCNISDPEQGFTGNNEASNNGQDVGNNATTTNNNTAPDVGPNNLDPLMVVSVSPEDGATGVPVDSVVTFTFSEPVDPASFTNAEVSVESDDGPVEFEATLDATSATIDFAPLQSAQNYTVTLSDAIASLSSGATLAAPVQVTFETTKFEVESVSPMDAATDLRVDTVVTITMNDDIDPESVTQETIVVRIEPPIFGLGEFIPTNFQVNGPELRIVSQRGFWQEFESKHTVTISSIKSTSGLESEPFTTSFSTRIFAEGERYRIRVASNQPEEFLTARTMDDVIFDKLFNQSEWEFFPLVSGENSLTVEAWAIHNPAMADLFLAGGDGSSPASLTPWQSEGSFFDSQIWRMERAGDSSRPDVDLPENPRSSPFV